MFDSFVTIHCSMYCDNMELIFSLLFTFLTSYYVFCHCDIWFDVTSILCISVLFGDKFGIQ